MQNNMLSLFDYLGYAAGKKLGEQVAVYAKVRKAKYNTRHISNSTYTGKIMLYTKEFLDEFFQIKKIFTEPDYTEINIELEKDYEKLMNESFNFDKIF